MDIMAEITKPFALYVIRMFLMGCNNFHLIDKQTEYRIQDDIIDANILKTLGINSTDTK